MFYQFALSDSLLTDKSEHIEPHLLLRKLNPKINQLSKLDIKTQAKLSVALDLLEDKLNYPDFHNLREYYKNVLKPMHDLS
jgi:hypothetical protein